MGRRWEYGLLTSSGYVYNEEEPMSRKRAKSVKVPSDKLVRRRLKKWKRV